MSKMPEITGDQINAEVLAKIRLYNDLGLFEQYAIFVGKAQIMEFGLKGLLARKFDVPHDKMNIWTLGKTKKELSNKGVREDFIRLLDSVVEYRNYIAHEFIVNTLITRSVSNFSDRKLYGDL